MSQKSTHIRNGLTDKARAQCYLRTMDCINERRRVTRVRISHNKLRVYIYNHEYDLDKIKRDPLANANIFDLLYGPSLIA